MAYPHEVTHNFPPDDAVGKVCSDSHDPEKHCLQTTQKGECELTPPAGCTDRAKKSKNKSYSCCILQISNAHVCTQVAA